MENSYFKSLLDITMSKNSQVLFTKKKIIKNKIL